MIARLTGTIHRLPATHIIVDVAGVGYLVSTPIDVWEKLQENEETTLHIATYVREDRFDLFGFSDSAGRVLFLELTKISGIGPQLGLDICAVPRGLLLQAIREQDSTVLENIKGIGKKRAEKLLVDLKSLLEGHPALFAGSKESIADIGAAYDADALAALQALGYDRATSLEALKHVSSDVESTEERVTAALRSL